ncbi:MAG: DUF1801 domain-containing protein [Planctomycetaceae bacterium]|nr:DUF1801 domain-containing protein [Planctomycetaceae bacterium]
MAENQTQETDASVEAFLESVEHPGRRADSNVLLDLMRRVTGAPPKMWGPAIIGFGKYHYRYDSGREGDMLRVGFSPRKANLALYVIIKDDDRKPLLAKLGKHKTGVSCLYINKLADVDLKVLEAMVARSWNAARDKYGNPE